MVSRRTAQTIRVLFVEVSPNLDLLEIRNSILHHSSYFVGQKTHSKRLPNPQLLYPDLHNTFSAFDINISKQHFFNEINSDKSPTDKPRFNSTRVFFCFGQLPWVSYFQQNAQTKNVKNTQNLYFLHGNGFFVIFFLNPTPPHPSPVLGCSTRFLIFQ